MLCKGGKQFENIRKNFPLAQQISYNKKTMICLWTIYIEMGGFIKYNAKYKQKKSCEF